jgi:hypothetical protein
VTSGRPEDAPPTVGERLLGPLRRYIAVLVVGALLLAIAPRLLHGSAERARNDPLPSLGVGALGALGYVLALIAIVVVTVFASIVLGLLGLGSLVAALGLGALLASAGLTFAFVLVVAFVADVILGLVTGRLLWRSGPQTPTRGAFGALALGVAVVVVLTSIPILGGLLRFLVVLVGLGALLLALRRRRAAAPTPAPTATAG